MSDYTKSTNFATKDNLSAGNSLKILKGTELDTEFNNIATAVATKADLASPTFTGTPTLPTGTIGVTQSTSDDSTKLATTAFVQDIAALVKDALFPVGSIYTNSSVSTNPATLLGFGTWSAFGAGLVLIGNGGGFSAGATGGSANAIVVSHTHTATTTSTDSGHVHPNTSSNAANSLQGGGLGFIANKNVEPFGNSGSGNANITSSTTIASTGSSGTNANLQPYIVVYMWQRTA
jgi:hypothetical protein